jgi:DNA-binding SARP family transcriptional activator
MDAIVSTSAPAGPGPATPVVRVLGGLSLVVAGRPVAVPPGSRRLLAYLALHPAGVDRRSAAGVLWPSVGDGRAGGNLRSALWRLQQVGCSLVRCDPFTLALADGVRVDLRELEAWADRVLGGTATPADLAVAPGPIADPELLPGCYDDWLLALRERLGLRMLHALEELGRLLRAAGRAGAAVEAVQVAVLADPLRESGQLALIEAHQAAGDWAAARRQYDSFRGMLRREIGVEPSPELTAMATRRTSVPATRV